MNRLRVKIPTPVLLAGAALMPLVLVACERDAAPSFERLSAPPALPMPARQGWAQERRTATLGSGARLTWVTIPSPQVPNDPLFDIHCLVMESATGAALSMVCPGAEQGAFSGLGQ